MVDALGFSRAWSSRRPISSELDATMCRLEIHVHNRLVTEYRAADGQVEGHLEIPSYYLAEWIAENWWALLFEPRKNDTASDDDGFLTRHSMLAAQHGFPLPALSVVSVGKIIHLDVLPRDVPFANIEFLQKAYAFALRENVQHVLDRFVTETVERLKKFEIYPTPLVEAWALVKNTKEDERQFCEVMGMLGLSPYDTHPDIEASIDQVREIIGERALRDLALATTERTFVDAVNAVMQANSELADSPPISIAPLTAIHLPPDNITVAGWQRGVLAAKKVRQRFDIASDDPKGGKTIFEHLGIDSEKWRANKSAEEAQMLFSGVVALENDAARMNLNQSSILRRHFTAARAAYLAWISGKADKVRRLVTHAVTRDQQASRAFAAELLAPIDYVQSQATGKKLPHQRIFDLATVLGVEPGVVSKQAENNGLVIASA